MNAARIHDDELLRQAIDRAIGDLLALKSRIYPSQIRTLELQADSAEAFADHARRIVEITGDLRLTAAEIAADLGNQFISDGDRRDIRGCETTTSILSDAQDWCDEVRAEVAA